MRRAACVHLLLTTLLVACDRGEHPPPRPLDGARVRLLGSSPPLPPSADIHFPAMTSQYACTFDTYEVQIACAARGGEEIARFGREGGGPGELGNIGELVSGPGETVASVDVRNRRISLFSQAGFVGDWPRRDVPPIAGDLPEDSTFTGHGFPAFAGPPVLTIANVHIGKHRHSVNWQVRLEFDPREVPSSGTVHLTSATRLRSGRFVADIAREGRTALALYDSTGGYMGLLRFPNRPTRYPSDGDLEAMVADYRRVFGHPPSEAELEWFRSRPLNNTPRAGLYRVVQEDRLGWLWVLTTSRTAGGTEIDVFDGTEYRGSVTLPDHVLGLQMSGDTLLVLAEVDDPDRLVATRRLDWYEILR